MPIEPSLQPDGTPEPIPPSSLPPYGTPPPPLSSGAVDPVVVSTGPSSTGLDSNVAAGLSTLVTLITGIIFLVVEKRDAFVRFWAMQSIVFGAAWFAVVIVFGIVHVILHAIFWPLGVLWGLFSAIVELGFLILWIIMMIQAFSGKEWEIPYFGKIARQQLAKNPTIGL
jgi:uncharacterized membrane protein